MQYELRQRVIEPRRQTFQYVANRLGDKPASRYEEGTLDIQPTENFHYRPLWDPSHELYDETYSAVRLTDPYSYRDPRQFYYTPYVTNRAALHDAFLKSLAYIDDRDLLTKLPVGWASLLGTVLVPLRHYESGAQLISVTGARFAYGASIEQCLSYAAFDRIGSAQMISRIGISLGQGTDEDLIAGKEHWIGAEHLQPLRRMIEELLVEQDWVVSTIGLDLVDRLLYPLLYRHLDEAAIGGGASAYGLLAQHFATWYVDQRKWLDALIAEWIADPTHGTANRKQLAAIVQTWLPHAIDAVTAVADKTEALVGSGALDFVTTTADSVRKELDDLGLVEQVQS
ncbi:phenol 2-monooxygenase [Flexivirga oryzae]|uniref:propane 2-monooxygenase n=1 Tax=Flexivirga oryzae TaxID=1794944 RepID=A0A839N2I4_9MICO|nr:phenol 2-monooxygenase [Flexivirga oryzae]MBB2891950.1 phenol hydroxylase P1 protein [Flexivirga oryzae]